MTVAGTSHSLRIELQIATNEAILPNDTDWETWVSAALVAGEQPMFGVVTVRLVSEDESATLNLSYRDKPGATNVLAFPGPGDELPASHRKEMCESADESKIETEIGDLIICLPVACQEAEEQGKRPVAHLAHLAIHGALHLAGYDHQLETDAVRMESLEVRILDELGFANPYINSDIGE